jgi:hypothetical protein
VKIICLITDENHPGFVNWLQPSCVHLDLELVVIEYNHLYRSHKTKDFLLLEYIKQSQVNEIIMFTDAYDTILLADEQEIMTKYKQFNSPVIFSAEKNCWPDAKLANKYPPETNKHFFKYLNSGGFIGESQYIEELIEKYYEGNDIDNSSFKWSNQYTWNQVYLKEQDNIKLDNRGEIFYTMSINASVAIKFSGLADENTKLEILKEEKDKILDEVIFEDYRLKSKITQTKPCHLHFSSPTAKYLMQTDFFNKLRKWDTGRPEK